MYRTRAMKSKQRGLTMFGFLFVAVVLVMLAMLAMKLVPAYIEYFSVKKILATMGQESDLKSKSNADIPAIAIYSLGPYRKSLTNDVKAEYYGLVENYIARVFQQNAKKLAGQSLEVKGSKDAGDSVLVKSILNMGGGGAMPVTWRLVKRGGGFRIFDVNVDGIWLASTQKTNFVSVLKKNNGQISALLDYLK
ncbi:MAG: DUF4845 domain-containing protein, partial [Thiobacillus sp.]|nr:DUF4845 domain-containing protein [Thiobacillus sp.]